MKKILIDKILLIATALVGFALTFLIGFSGEKSVGKEWAMFILMSIAYFVMLFVGAFPIIKKFKQAKRIRFLLYLGVAYVLTVGSAYIVFVFDILPMPERHRIYILVMIVLGTITIGSLEYFVRKMKFFRSDIQKQKADGSE